jgi:hypothetical protein
MTLLAAHWPGLAFFIIFGGFAAFIGGLLYLEKRIQSDVDEGK